MNICLKCEVQTTTSQLVAYMYVLVNGLQCNNKFYPLSSGLLYLHVQCIFWVFINEIHYWLCYIIFINTFTQSKCIYINIYIQIYTHLCVDINLSQLTYTHAYLLSWYTCMEFASSKTIRGKALRIENMWYPFWMSVTEALIFETSFFLVVP